MSAEGALDLPSLAVSAAIVPSPHLSSVLRQWPSPRSVRNSSSRKHRRPDPERLAAECVEVLCVIRLVAQQSADRVMRYGLRHGGNKLARVVAGSFRHLSGQPEMGLQIADRRELGIRHRVHLNAAAPLEVATDVTRLQPRRIDRSTTAGWQKSQRTCRLHHDP